MKNKGLGRIPNSLSWIGSVEEEMATQKQHIHHNLKCSKNPPR